MDIKNGLVRGFLKVIGGLWAKQIDVETLKANVLEGAAINSIRSSISSLQTLTTQLNSQLNKRMICGNTLINNTNFNNVVDSGVYRFNDRNNYINPPPISWGQLLVIHSAGDTIAQMAFDYSNALFYLRTGNPSEVGGSGKWTQWVCFMGANGIRHGSTNIGKISANTGGYKIITFNLPMPDKNYSISLTRAANPGYWSFIELNQVNKTPTAAMAEAFDIAVAPHAPYGPIALAASIQVDVCTPNVFIQEQSLGIHYNRGFDLLDFVKNKEMFQYHDGYVDIPKGPGLGVEIDEEKVKEVSTQDLNWRNPKWKNHDGTMAEW